MALYCTIIGCRLSNHRHLGTSANHNVPRAVYNVKSYGAHGDGLAHTPDESAGIQAAIDAASAAGGGTVEIPAGTYLLHTPRFPQATFIQPKSNVTIEGEGDSSVLMVDAGLLSLNFNVISAEQVGNPYVSNVRFTNFVIDENSTNNLGNSRGYHLSAIAIANGSDVTIDHMLIRNANGWNPILIGDWQYYRDTMTNVKVTDNRLENMANDAALTDTSIVWVNAVGTTISRNSFSNPSNAVGAPNIGGCIEVHGYNIVVSNNQINFSMSNGVTIGSGRDTHDVTVTGNAAFKIHSFVELFQAATFPIGYGNAAPDAGPVILDSRTSDILISNNTVDLYGNSVSDTSAIVDIPNHVGYSYDKITIRYNLFYVEHNNPSFDTMIIWLLGNYTNTTIDGNVLIGAKNDGIRVQLDQLPVGSNFSSDIIIKNNKILDCASSGIRFTALAETSPRHVRYTITDNVIADTRASPVMNYGVTLTGQLDTLTMGRNTIVGATVASVLMSPLGNGFTRVSQ